jgi:nascent polypeptide-associated complex subunit alpha
MQNFVEEVADQDHTASHVHGPNCSHDHDHDDSNDAAVHDIHGRIIMNRNEKKARKELLKLGLKPIEGIHRVTFKRGKMIFAITEPEVYKNPTSDSYIVFGEARVEDSAFQAQMAAAQRMAQRAASEAAQKEPSHVEEAEEGTEGDEAEEGAEQDTEGLNESDIKIVMEQANVSRFKAIKALREHDNDVVNTIMELSM